MARTALRWATCLILAGASMTVSPSIAPGQHQGKAPEGGKQADLPLPGKLPLQEYEKPLYRFILTRAYAAPPYSWTSDREVRDTGPFVGGLYYGTHPAVRVYYSPEMIRWLNHDRQGEIHDGAMIVKEMFPPPAALYADPLTGNPPPKDPRTGASALDPLVSAWTVMVKDRSIAQGGWFYSGPFNPTINPAGKTPEQILEAKIAANLSSYGPPFDVPISGSAQGICQRCHGSAVNELTFSSLTNVLPFPFQPIRFRNDDTWRDESYLNKLPKNVRDLFYAPPPPPSPVDAPPTIRLASAPAMPRALMARSPDDEDDQKRFEALGLHGPQARRALRSLRPSPLMMAAPAPPPTPDPLFLATFPMASPTDTPKMMPGQWADHVVAGPKGAEAYITSDNCLGCHGGLGGAPYGVTMFAQNMIESGNNQPPKPDPKYGHGYNLSEYGEWRWSPMGLAGRDPIFHSQIESEINLLKQDFPGDPGAAKAAGAALVNVCSRCHGAMGQRQLEIDAKAGQLAESTGKPLDPNFKLEYFDLTTALTDADLKQPDYDYHKYGNLAREGVSCAICHHIDAPDPAKVAQSKLTDIEYFLMRNTTGTYERGPDNVLNGPFDKVAVVPMQATLGVTPKVNPFLKDSRMCGSCHVINLPNVDAPFPGEYPILNEAESDPLFKKYSHSIEQATFLEWQNSVFGAPGSKEFKSCQDCHMPGGFVSPDRSIKLDQVVTQVASVEDSTYPMFDHGAKAEDLFVPVRRDYRRHELVGLNVFIETMFKQANPILGVSLLDPMTGPFDLPGEVPYDNRTNGNVLATANMVRQGVEGTVDVAITLQHAEKLPLIAQVTVTNKTGHRFPSGVGFRRAFLEVVARRKSTREIFFSSGRTNSVGVIVDGQGKPLETDFLPNARTYQEHHQLIMASNQVQIYEELTQNANHEFNTSFIHRDHHPKDNRLLARGWLSVEHLKDKSPIVAEFMKATGPEGKALEDPDYGDNGGMGATGTDRISYMLYPPQGVADSDIEVTATMIYQAIPPFFLRELFRLAPQEPATRRLYYIASRLKTQGTAMEDWKLRLSSATAGFPPAR